MQNVTEVECKTPEDAMEAFQRGQKQRSVSATQLNMNSSRSHSIFNIRVVAAPLDSQGEDIFLDNGALVVGQLALVDLAGSERTNRTGNVGQRLQEASKINQSLMTLRSCIELLRENQTTGGSKTVPYRDSKITHLFKNYFEGEGKVKMIVCVNPRPSDYEENINVMQFAELTQEIQIERAVGPRIDLGLTPGRRKANQVYKEAVRRLEEQGHEVAHLTVDLAPVYSLGPEWPPLELTQFDNEEIVKKLMVFLEKRIQTRKALQNDLENKRNKFREKLRSQENENILLKAENKQLRTQLENERKRVISLEQRLVNAESANRSLTNKVNAYNDMREVLENELDEKELALNMEQRKKIEQRHKFKAKMVDERDKIKTELAGKFSEREKAMKIKHGRTTAKLNALKNLLDDDTCYLEGKYVADVETTSDPKLSICATGSSPKRRRSLSSSPRRSVAVSNPKHRRSISHDADNWIDHRPVVGGPVPSGTVLQPVLRNRKSVNQLEVHHLKTPSKYVLTTSTQDEEGDVETRLFKGDVIPTVGGGKQVVFNDVEVLTQLSPNKAEPVRKRSYEDFRGVSDRIAYLENRGMDGGNTPAKGKRSRF